MKKLTKIEKIIVIIALFFAIWGAIALPMKAYVQFHNPEIFARTALYSKDYNMGYGVVEEHTYYEYNHPILSEKYNKRINKQSFKYATIAYPIVLSTIGVIILVKRKTSSKR